eukprot:CAMPEP_0119316204 /NCGR_PEP_ID=MMETSP1333-20130426/38982_1 /TAXON_ID=418940 /ORGANISM="Scyphosphaera apsteinii, Strain RCC1455" /LENGTH=100 /DNA_ID=CAMNT_0007321791 /DNA_START=59 /DNA_END=361 /DNA_ORIENTATION=-
MFLCVQLQSNVMFRLLRLECLVALALARCGRSARSRLRSFRPQSSALPHARLLLAPFASPQAAPYAPPFVLSPVLWPPPADSQHAPAAKCPLTRQSAAAA